MTDTVCPHGGSTVLDFAAREWSQSFSIPHTLASEFEYAVGRSPTGCAPSAIIGISLGIERANAAMLKSLETRLFDWDFI